jgi:effector-binding domain-containing protein
MEGMGGKDFWQKLQEGCRLGKLDAKRRKGITIILVQTSKEDELRLSTLMMTHADYAMFIKYSPDSDEEDFVDITMPKARKIKKTPFTVGKDLAYARFINYDKEKPEKVTGPGRKVTTDKPIRTQGGQKTAQAGQKSPQIERSQIDDEIESYFADKDNF